MKEFKDERRKEERENEKEEKMYLV